MTPKQRLRAILMGSARAELNRQYSAEELGRGLAAPEGVVYRRNGNRAVTGKRLLKALRPALQRIGVTRIANISGLATSRFPVFQSARPNVLYHTEVGQNSGGQGKGVDDVQAELSCSMETVEGYCGEPRNPQLIRGSYAFLRDQHVLLDPRHLVTAIGARRPTATEPFMWTPAFSLSLRREILVPAAAVYFPFMQTSYRTRSVFPCNSNGLASGATYLEASTHALYELIERFYTAMFEAGTAKLEAIYEEELTGLRLRDVERRLDGEFKLQVYVAKIPGLGKTNLPMVVCYLVGDGMCYLGSGCSSEVDVSLSRAISEALQSAATVISGTREDMARKPGRATKPRFEFPRFRSLRYVDYTKQVVNRKFDDLRTELHFIARWLKRAGYPEICLANLTRAGVEIPVVKAIVPGLPFEAKLRACGRWRIEQVVHSQFKGA